MKAETEQEKKVNEKKIQRYGRKRFHEIVDGKLVVTPVYSFNNNMFGKICDWLVKINSTNLYSYSQPEGSKYRLPQFKALKSQPWYGSYHLKHVCEQALGEYVSNCDLKDAAIHLGFKIRLYNFDDTDLRDFTHPNFDIKLEKESRIELLQFRAKRLEELFEYMDNENSSKEWFDNEVNIVSKFAFDHCNIEGFSLYDYKEEFDLSDALVRLALCEDDEEFFEIIYSNKEKMELNK